MHLLHQMSTAIYAHNHKYYKSFLTFYAYTDYLLLVPLANVEQSFSAMNLLWSPLQASLNISNLDWLMRTNLSSVNVNLPDHMLPILLKKFKDGRKGRPC